MGKGKKKIVPNGQEGHGRATIGLPSKKNQEKLNQIVMQAMANRKPVYCLPSVEIAKKERAKRWAEWREILLGKKQPKPVPNK